MSDLRRLLAGLLASFPLLAPTGAAAFSAPGHRWPDAASRPVPYMVDPAGSRQLGGEPVVAAVRRAFAAWEEVSCSLLSFSQQTFSPSSPEQRNIIQVDDANRVFFADDADAWPGDRGTLALTFTAYTLDENRVILDADIVFNGVHWRWTTSEAAAGQGSPPAVDFETVMFHEVGHFLGLGHSEDPEAAMFAANNKPVMRRPARNDVEGVCALYSNGRPLPNAPGAGEGAPVGAPCLTHTNCSESICIDDGARNERYCSRECEPGRAGRCPSGFTCELAENGQGYCLKPEPVDELCDPCNLHEHCVTGLCVTVPNRNQNAPFCSRPCDPTPGQPAQCPAGFQCELTQQRTTQIAVCVPTQGICSPGGRGGHLQTCFGNGTCKPGHGCFSYWTDVNFCYALCDPRRAGESCGTERSVCRAVPGVANTAFCAEVARPGEPCAPEQCDDRSLCAFDPEQGLDSALCYAVCPRGLAEECPANFDCVNAGLAAPICMPLAGFKQLGESCRSDAECTSRLCRVIGDLRLCTNECVTTNPDACPTGLSCAAPSGSVQGLCWPRGVGRPDAPRDRTPAPVEGYCPCDRTTQCDRDCDCDPDCTGGCAHTRTGREGPGLVFLILAAALCFGRLRKGR